MFIFVCDLFESWVCLLIYGACGMFTCRFVWRVCVSVCCIVCLAVFVLVFRCCSIFHLLKHVCGRVWLCVCLCPCLLYACFLLHGCVWLCICFVLCSCIHPHMCQCVCVVVMFNFVPRVHQPIHLSVCSQHTYNVFAPFNWLIEWLFAASPYVYIYAFTYICEAVCVL